MCHLRCYAESGKYSPPPTSSRGSPGRTARAESFIGTDRREVLDAEVFQRLIEAQVMSERWRRLYNTYRPHSKHKHHPPATAYPLAKAL